LEHLSQKAQWLKHNLQLETDKPATALPPIQNPVGTAKRSPHPGFAPFHLDRLYCGYTDISPGTQSYLHKMTLKLAKLKADLD
jgi:hypothetical protein